MKKTLKNNIFLVWLSLTLAVLFFHPLIASLHDNAIILQWRRQNTLELLADIAILTAIFTLLLWCIDRYCDRYFKLAAYYFIIIIPLLSFGTHLGRQLGYTGALIDIGQYINTHRVLCSAIGFSLVAVLVFLSAKYPSRILHVIFMILVALSPINILGGWIIWKAKDINTVIELKKSSIPLKTHDKAIKKPDHDIIVLLFDELSYDFLYHEGVVNSKYPNIKYLASISDNYHAAIAPGDQTLTSLPGLLMGKRFDNVLMEYNSIYYITEKNKKDFLNIDRHNLFDQAKRNGYRTLLIGPYLPYCELFGDYVDECRSFSIYNYGTIERNFSLLNPLLTTMIIWPRQMPQGIIKNKVVSLWQKKETQQTYNFTMNAVETNSPTFLFAHFYFTHVPFVFNKNGYYENKYPFLQNRENYLKQLDYLDHFLGEFIVHLKQKGKFDRSTIVLLADHNYRIMFPSMKKHIPVIIKKPYQNFKKDIFEPAQAEILLKKTLINVPMTGKSL